MVPRFLPLLAPLFAACVTATPPKDHGVDADGDGFTTADDCDDTTDAVFPGAPESCNGVDDDCDGATDETGASGEGTFYTDADGDGHGTANSTATACTAPPGFAANFDDCDDENALVYPTAPEHCDDADENCNGTVDEDAVDAASWYDDADGDYHGAGSAVVQCDAPEGTVAVGDDCDDTTGLICPGNDEHCDGVDENCDGLGDTDSVDASTWFADTDADGFGDAANTMSACDAPTGYVADATDCDDATDTVYPGAIEHCDGLLQNCGGEIDADADDALTWYADSDSDTFGDVATPAYACEQPAGFVADATDCNDSSNLASPTGTEACDTLDNDCDGSVDEAGATGEVTVYLDADGDGYGVSTSTILACTAPAGYAAVSTDCNDGDSDANPGADEYCGGGDEDCDGTVDEDAAVDATAWYGDADVDGYGGGTPTYSCTAPAGSVASSTDCNDASGTIHPGATETCNGTDTNCSGDETDAVNAHTYYADVDADGYGDVDSTTRGCSVPTGYASNDDDCDDAEIDVNPGETEVCDNGLDDDCDGTSNGCAPSRLFSTEYTYDASLYSTYESNFGEGAKAAVDVDHDGDLDLLMSKTESGYSGEVYAIGGPISAGIFASSPATYTGTSGDYLGATLSNVGDVDLDGFDDLLIGAPCANSSNGTAYLWYSATAIGTTTATADATIDGDSGYGFAAGYTGPARDTNGDGLAELLIYGYGGTVSLFDGVPAGGLTRADAATSITASTGGFTSLGYENAAPGDINGDGYDDLYIGSGYDASGYGAIYEIDGPFGSTVDVSSAYAARLVPTTLSAVGYAFDAADVTGDGEIDLVARANDSSALSGYRMDVYAGPITGTITTAAADSSTNNFYYVSTHGDVDGDGATDILYSNTYAYADYATGWYLSYYTAGGASYAFTRNSGGNTAYPGYHPILADMDDDGFDDIVTGVHQDDSGGTSYYGHDYAVAIVFGGGY